MVKNCPKCNSKNIKIVNYIGIKCIVCKKCGYDERGIYEVYPEAKTSQKAKAGFSPYKSGGHGRVKKREIYRPILK